MAGSFATDNVFDHVGRDVGDFFFAQRAFERRHAAAAIGHLFFGAGLFFGFRLRRQVRTAVATEAVRAVADGAVFGEDFFAGFRVRRTARSAAFFGLRRLTGVHGPFFFCFQAFRFFHRAFQREDPEVFAVRRRREAVATRVEGDLLFAFVFERGHRRVGRRPGLPVPEFLSGLHVVGDQVAVVVADEQEAARRGHRARVTRFFGEFVLPGDLAGTHVVGGEEPFVVEAGPDNRVGADVGSAFDELLWVRWDDQPGSTILRADEVHVLFRVI